MSRQKQPKTLQVLVKTHKLTIFLTAEAATPILTLKEQAFSALRAPVLDAYDNDEAEVHARAAAASAPSPAAAGAAADDDAELELDSGAVDLGLASDAAALGAAVGIAVPDPGAPPPQRPVPASVDALALCRGVRDKATRRDAEHAYQMTGIASVPETFEVLDDAKTAGEIKLLNWETLYVRFRDEQSGELLPVYVTPFPPPIQDDEDDARARRPPTPELEPSNAKRKRRGSP